MIRASLLEVYVSLLFKPVFYISQRNSSYPMRVLKWDPMFNPEEETSTVIAPSCHFLQISLEEVAFSLAPAVGKSLQDNLATKNQTQPSCARVKVELDLLGDFPKCMKIGIRSANREILDKWIHIKYDCIPKYCKICMI